MESEITKSHGPVDSKRKAFQLSLEQECILQPIQKWGSVHVYHIEPGLMVRMWNCRLNGEAELVLDLHSQETDFTLAFFPERMQMQLSNDKRLWHKNAAWNIIFAGPICLRLHLAHETNACFLSLHFTQDWLRNHVCESYTIFSGENVRNRSGEGFFMLESMSAKELESVLAVQKESWQKSLGILYVKSHVLTLVNDFFARVSDTELNKLESNESTDVLASIEQELVANISSALPPLKELASRFSLSESSLKRHFKQKHGENISSFFQKQ
ncbi:helix-turn-helix transcriptional regulator [Flavisolibacter sp. BT320]|nr:helix-turn-helix transcriptional regulator [Flavisolibacter longurius]